MSIEKTRRFNAIREMAAKTGRYLVRYFCPNCRNQFEEGIQYGTEAPKRITCPRCGCFGAEKPW